MSVLLSCVVRSGNSSGHKPALSAVSVLPKMTSAAPSPFAPQLRSALSEMAAGVAMVICQPAQSGETLTTSPSMGLWLTFR